MSYAFCERFPEELAAEIFAHILKKALNEHMVDPSAVFVDGTHIKAGANKKKHQKKRVAETAKVYSDRQRAEVDAERKKLGTKPIGDLPKNDPPSGSAAGTTGRSLSMTDPDSVSFVRGEHERCFAYDAHTACYRHGFILGVEVTAGNIHDSVAFDDVYRSLTARFDPRYFVMDAGYKTPWIAKKLFSDGREPILPYTRPKTPADR